MPKENKPKVVENTTPIAEALVQGNGAEPTSAPLSPLSPVQKAITLVELHKDLTQLNQGLANLQRQVLAQMGAIQYIQGKIQQLEKVESESSDC